MDGRLGEVRADAARAAPTALTELEDWLRIPSVSGVPAHAADVDRAARWVVGRLERAGAAVRQLRGGAGPVVIARTPGRGGATTVVYGHLDVKPPGPGWTTSPFRPTRRGPRLQARGASDDKGQLMSHLVALAAWDRAGGPPGDVVTIVDGAEEIGSPGLSAVLARERRRLLSGPVAGVVVVDTRAAGPGRPTVTVSQRGAFGMRVVVDVGGRPVHAGRLGGAVADPSMVLVQLLARADRLLAALPQPGGARPPEPTTASIRAAAMGRAVHADDPVGRTTRRGLMSVTRMRACAAAGSVPTRARAYLDVRLPPGVAPAPVMTRLQRELRRDLPTGIRVLVDAGPGEAGLLITPPRQVRVAVDDSCRAAYGRPATSSGSGGSIGAVGVLRRVFAQDPVLLGLAPADDGAHGPDEYLDVREWPAQVDTHVVLLGRIAALRTPRSGHGSGPLSSATVQGLAASGERKAQRFSGVT